jgi:hypothetical protein
VDGKLESGKAYFRKSERQTQFHMCPPATQHL